MEYNKIIIGIYSEYYQMFQGVINMTTPHPLPNIFQANLLRFYARVIRPTMEGLQTHDTLETGEAASLDEFASRSAAMVDNYTANEAAKAYTLIVSGLFERQLSVWAAQRGVRAPKRPKTYVDWAGDCATGAGFDFDGMKVREDLNEARLVANVVRHGIGTSCRDLMAVAPHLWAPRGPDYIDLLSVEAPDSETLLIRSEDLKRYVRAS